MVVQFSGVGPVGLMCRWQRWLLCAGHAHSHPDPVVYGTITNLLASRFQLILSFPLAGSRHGVNPSLSLILYI